MENKQLAVKNYGQLKSLLASESVKERFSEVLGQRAGQFIASVLNAVYLNDNLRECDPNTIIVAAMNAAVLDLPIDPNLGFSYIIPYKDHGIPKARFQVGYKGFLQLALRTGQYKMVNATRIFEGEVFKIDRLTGEASLLGEQKSDKVIGYAAYIQLRTGFKKAVYMTVEEVTAHAKKFSQSYEYRSSPWKSNFDDMALKTVLSRLLKKWGAMTTEVMRPEDELFGAGTQVSGLPEFIPYIEGDEDLTGEDLTGEDPEEHPSTDPADFPPHLL